MKKYFAILIAAFSLFSLGVHAQQLKFSSGIKDGTYYTIVDQALGLCVNDGSLVNEENKGGSPTTITNILNNKVAGGPVQFDVLWLRSQNQDLTRLKSLFQLHPEQIHIFVKASGFSDGKMWNSKSWHAQNVQQLKGLNLAAQGGSMYTAQAINQLTGIGYNIVSDFADTDAVVAAVKEGKVHAGLVVGGAPVKQIAAMGKDLRLVSFDPQTLEKLQNVYRKTSVVYENLSTSGIPTVEVDSIFIVNNYKSPAISANLLKFRDCVKTNAATLEETPGNHPAWRNAKLNSTDKPRWDLYTGK